MKHQIRIKLSNLVFSVSCSYVDIKKTDFSYCIDEDMYLP